MKLLYYRASYKLRTNDFDSNDKIKPSAILELFQDIAGSHANEIGVGFKETYDKGMFWVLVRTKLNIIRPLTPLMDVKISTWPKKKGKIDFNREYVIEDLDGNVLVTGISKWVVIDINTRKITRTDNISFNGDTYYEKDNYGDITKLKMPDKELFNKIYAYRVLKRDVDHNLHMNNTKYADVILDIFPDKNITSFQMEYIKESKKDSEIELYEYIDGNNYYYEGYSDKELSFTAKIELGD